MGIKAGDVKLVKSAVSGDQDESGGAPTSTVIADNSSNAIFNDISESDRARGRVNMTKVHISVQTPDTDTYLGANFIVARPPEDPNVSIAMFTTDDVYDTRSAAQARLEAYLNKGPEWAGYLYENHIAGQRAVQIFQRTDAELPVVGQTLVLIGDEGKSTEASQYIRATKVSVQVRTFTIATESGFTDFAAAIVTLDLSDALRYDFTGSSASRLFSRTTGSAILRDTVVADAASYVGVKPLSAEIAIGDFTAKVPSIYTQLVPSAQTETPIPATPPQGVANYPVAGAAPITFTYYANWGGSTNLVLPGGCKPGSLTITQGSTTITDKAGSLMSGGVSVGTIDYPSGVLSLLSWSVNGNKSITYTPAAYAQRMPQSADIAITAESRRLNYTGFLAPVAVPGTLKLSYRAQSKWYELSDDGSGALRGYDASFGAGTFNFDTGAYVITLGVLPDVGSSLVFQWGVPTQETAWPVADISLYQLIDLGVPAGETLDPAFLQITWNDGVKACTATGNTSGALTGDGSGTIDIAAGTAKFCPNVMPPVGTVLTVAYDHGAKQSASFSNPARNGDGKLALNAGATNLKPGSVSVQWPTQVSGSATTAYSADQLAAMGVSTTDSHAQTARDDGAGSLYVGSTLVGTINYTSGDVLLSPDVTMLLPYKITYYSRIAVTYGTVH